MSTGVSDQRMRGQGSQANGPKEQLNDHEEFSSWRNQSLQQNYVAPGNDPYLSSYYGTSFPYQLDGAWSSNSVPGAGGAAEGGVAFLGGYGVQGGAGHHQDSYGIDGMFGSNGGFGNFGQPGFSGGYGLQGNGTTAAEYSTWERKAHYDDYYQPRGPDHHSVYQSSRMEETPSVKQVEQGMQGLALEQTRESSTKSTLPESAPVSSSGGGGGSSSQPKKLTWASIASQPAKPQLTTKKKSMVPPPMVTPRTPSLDIGTWENKNGGGSSQQATMAPPTISMAPPPIPQAAPTQQQAPVPQPTAPKPMPPAATPHRPPVVYQNAAARPPPTAQRSANPAGSTPAYPPPSGAPPTSVPPPPSMMNAPPPPPSSSMVPAVSPSAGVLSSSPSNPVLEELQSKHIYNPKEFDLTAKNARFFVIKSYSEDDIHRSIKYEIWCSTEHGNKRLDSAFRERDGKGAVYLYFSVNGSGHFCGMAEMTSPVDMSSSLSVWSQDKWRGQFTVKWIYVKDVPNSALRHIRLENNENKPVTNSRDTQEVPVDKGRQVLKIIHTFRHATSIFDDFTHYEKRQAEEDQRKSVVVSPHESHYDGHGGGSQQPRPDRGDRDRDPRDRDRDHRDRERDHRDFGRGDRDRDMYRHERDHRDIRDGGGGGRGGGGRSGGGGNGYDFRERDAYRERDNRNHRDGFRDRDRERDRDRDSFPPHRGPGGGGRSGHRDNGRMRH